MRLDVVIRVLALSAIAVATAAPSARAAAGSCTTGAQCTLSGQVCDIPPGGSAGTCAFVVTDAAQLAAAVASANTDVAEDLIRIPAPPAGPPDAGPPPPAIDFDDAAVTDPALGPTALPIVQTPIRIEGESAAECTIDVGDRHFAIVRTSATLDVQPVLTLRRITVQHSAQAAIVVDSVATTGGGRGSLVAEFTTFDANTGGRAGAVVNDGEPLNLLAVTFSANVGDGAGAVTTTTGGSVRSCTFTANQGGVPAIEARGSTTTLTLQGTTVQDHEGDQAPVVSEATTTISGGRYQRNINTGTGGGGAVLARNLTVTNAVFADNQTEGNGGALALLDTPASTAASIVSTTMTGNNAVGDGGAIYALAVPISITGGVFRLNHAGGRGGAVMLHSLDDRNGAAVHNAAITNTTFEINTARPLAVMEVLSGALDELGDQIGKGALTLDGDGGAVYVLGGSDVDITSSCFLNNGTSALAIASASAVVASGNWWGAVDGPGPTGAGDVVRATNGLTVATPLAAPPTVCADAVAQTPEPVEVTVITSGTAQIGVDYSVIRSGLSPPVTVLTRESNTLLLNPRNRLLFDIVGVNDADQEGLELVQLSFVDCPDGPAQCPQYHTDDSSSSDWGLTDNGDGAGEGEGEGEGETGDQLEASPTTVTLVRNGDAAEGTVKITNSGDVDVTLNPPLIRRGSTQGFSVDPVPFASLALPAGETLTLTLRWQKVEDTPDQPAEEVTGGALSVSTTNGAVVEIEILLDQGCACRSTSGAPLSGPAALGLAALGGSLLRRRRRGGGG